MNLYKEAILPSLKKSGHTSIWLLKIILPITMAQSTMRVLLTGSSGEEGKKTHPTGTVRKWLSTVFKAAVFL